MPKKVAAQWSKTRSILLKDLGDLHTKCGSVVFGFAIEGSSIKVVISSHFRRVALASETQAFLRQVTGLQRVVSPIEFQQVEEHTTHVRVARPDREHDSRVTTLINTVNSAAFQQQAELFLFFTVKPGSSLATHFQSSPQLSAVKDLPFWKEHIEGALSAFFLRGDETATASTSGRGTATARVTRRQPVAPAEGRRVRRRQADGVLHGLDAEPNTDLWYSTRLQLDPSLYTPIRLPNYLNPTTGVEERCWALPNCNLDTQSLGRTPVQVNVPVNGGQARCTCDVFRALVERAANPLRCPHIQCVRTYMQQLLLAAVPTANAVIPIQSSLQAANGAPPACFWANQSFVAVMHRQQGPVINCRNRHTGHGDRCSCVQAVQQHLQANGMGNANGDGGAEDDLDAELEQEATHQHGDGDPLHDDPAELFQPLGFATTYPPTEALKVSMEMNMLNQCHQIRSGNGRIQCIYPLPAPGQRCRCQHSAEYASEGWEQRLVVRVPDAVVHQSYPLLSSSVAVCSLECPNGNPACSVAFDHEHAAAWGFLKHSDQTFVAFDMIYRFVNQFISDGCTLEGFVRGVRLQHEQASAATQAASKPFCSVSTFRRCYYRFAYSLQRDYTFQCPICKDAPEVLIGDATHATVHKRLYCGKDITAPEADVVIPRGHTRAHRCACGLHALGSRRAGIQQSILRFAQYVKGRPARGQPSSVLPFDPSRELDDAIAAAHHIHCGEFFQWVHEGIVGFQFTNDQRGSIAHFLEVMGSDSPVVSYFPLRTAEYFQQLFGTDPQQRMIHSRELFELRLQAPIICHLLAAVQQVHPTQSMLFPARLTAVFSHLIAKAKDCALGPPVHDIPCAENGPSCNSDACLQTGICTGVAQVRQRGRYAADQDSDNHNCNHGFSTHGRRTGGIFTWFCKHQVCYGFYMLPNAEGRDEAFSFLLTRFSAAPRVVVYDFACALHEYCLNREPDFFKHTRFVVDRFHWRNHQSCARSYDMSLYEDLSGLNSQIAEQCNSALRRIKASIAQMRQQAFMFNVRLYLDEWNKKKVARLEAMLAYAQNIS